VRFHVDDLMSSHEDPAVNTKLLKWLNALFCGYGEVKGVQGAVHDYLGMTFDFSQKGKVIIDMIDYMNCMVDNFSVDIGTQMATTPAGSDLFAIGNDTKLNQSWAEEFHTFVAKALFACKRACPDIQTAVALLCTRVKSPNKDDWCKLICLLKFINGTRQDKLVLSATDLNVNQVVH
jgi:hypothetical protein